MAGDVIGVDSLGATDAQNIGFAINVATARHVFEDLVQYGKSHHPFLGATLDDMTPSVAKTLSTSLNMGALISDIDPDSPIATAGLSANDIVVHFDKEDVVSAAGLVRNLWRHEVGDTIEVVYWRAGQRITANIKLGERPTDTASV